MAAITTEALENNWTVTQYAAALKKGLQQTIDKMSIARANTFARTETGSISSASRFDAFKSSDIREHEWLSAGDEMVRCPPDSLYNHAIDGEKITVGGIFSNNLQYPLDPKGEAGNVCNCRCVALPVIGD